eukprot:644541-Alexandrium_andersonii.AAC.1
MSASLVGSEMCIRDSSSSSESGAIGEAGAGHLPAWRKHDDRSVLGDLGACLLYTSDAADDM